MVRLRSCHLTSSTSAISRNVYAYLVISLSLMHCRFDCVVYVVSDQTYDDDDYDHPLFSSRIQAGATLASWASCLIYTHMRTVVFPPHPLN